MTYTTANFETGSEFRVQWTTEISNPRYDRKRAMMQRGRYRVLPHIATKHVSETFATYEEAKSFSDSLVGDVAYKFVMVRLPGNKNFRSASDTKKI